ncbi:hypothetical protein JI62_21615 [Halomonas campaniensis]|uniref:Uncharacterized protein n=1 Tax=Halomonas campaniensis TaxID=213554 RepID=A0A246RUX0_9GAMM|nr:hypothetical protein JI62_21615 [Halomonas campaniensis]
MFLEPCLLANLLTAHILSRRQQQVKAFMFFILVFCCHHHSKNAQIIKNSLNLASELGTTNSSA